MSKNGGGAGVLAGTKVVDLTHALAGPMCTYHLQLQGAEVIKVEPRGRGDDFRARGFGRFSCMNGGKRSLTLDLKTTAGQHVLHRLLAEADVLVENFRPGAAAKLGLDWESLHARYPKLIFCSITGFGQTGPLSQMPAIEWSVQSVSGTADAYVSDIENPMDLGVGMLDPVTGYVAFSAILAALLNRMKTGEGDRIDMAMLDTAFLIGANTIAAALQGQPAGVGRRPTMARFRTKEGRIFIAALHEKWLKTLCEIIDGVDILTDPRFSTAAARDENQDAFVAVIEDKLAGRTAKEWEETLVAAGIPAGAARSYTEMAAHDHVRERGTMMAVDTLDEGQINVSGAPFRLPSAPPSIQGPVPALGQHSKEILREYGYGEADIEKLAADGII